jgi:hypothetical protein
MNLLASHKVDRRPFFLWFICVILVFLCASVDWTFYDAGAYLKYFLKFETSSLGDFFKIDNEFELGFELFTKICRLVYKDNFILYLITIALLNLFLVGKALKAHPAKKLVLILYIGSLGFYYNIIVLRQSIALSFSFLAFVNFEKSKLKTFFYALIACLFHKSAIVLFPVFVLAMIVKTPKSRRFYFCTLILSIIIYVTGIIKLLIGFLVTIGLGNILNSIGLEKYLVYLTNFSNRGIFMLVNMIAFSIVIFILIRFSIKESEYNTYLLMIVVGFFIFCSLPGESNMIRIFDYFVIPIIIVLPRVCKDFRLERKLFLYALSMVRIGMIIYLIMVSMNMF